MSPNEIFRKALLLATHYADRDKCPWYVLRYASGHVVVRADLPAQRPTVWTVVYPTKALTADEG